MPWGDCWTVPIPLEGSVGDLADFYTRCRSWHNPQGIYMFSSSQTHTYSTWAPSGYAYTGFTPFRVTLLWGQLGLTHGGGQWLFFVGKPIPPCWEWAWHGRIYRGFLWASSCLPIENPHRGPQLQCCCQPCVGTPTWGLHGINVGLLCPQQPTVGLCQHVPS